jgi:putative peptide zinc metalloprotease protein
MLRAPSDGIVIPPTAQVAPIASAERLAGWQGTPLDPHNRGCFLETGSLVCLVGNPQRLEALLVIEQSEVAFVRVGQPVRVRIEQAPVLVLTGTIKELAKTDAGDLPASLAHTLDLPMQDGGSQGARAAGTYYQARIAFDPHQAPLLVGMHGDAKVLADWEPLAFRVWRYVQRTFRLG